MKRRIFLILLLIGLVTVFCAAAADSAKPTGGLKPIQDLEGTEKGRLEAEKRAEAKGTGDIIGPSSCVTGQEYSWSVTDSGSGHLYTFYMAVLDHSYENPNTADVQLSLQKQSKKSFTYTFYFPGDYLVYIMISDRYGQSLYENSLRVEVADGGENEVTKQIKEVAAANKADNDFQTVLNLHDWVIDHNTYDYTYTWYSADALFRLGTGVCNTYVRALAKLLDQVGIPNRRVTGKSSGQGHTWSAVKLGSKWYLIDPTWDDSKDNQIDYNRHCYYNVNYDLMSIEHENSYYVGGKVTCDSLDENYFIHTDTWKNYATNTVNQFNKDVKAGWHHFSLPMPNYDRSSRYSERMLASVAALGLTRSNDGKFIYNEKKEKITGYMNGGTLELPDKLTTIGKEAFEGTAANYVTVPKTCTRIESLAFANSDIWEITIPSSVKYIAPDAFKGYKGKLVIVTPKGSYAAKYAKKHHIETVSEW